MKKLLGVIGILALATALLPAQGYADLRGSFAPLTIASGFVNGCEQPTHRPVDAGGVMVFGVDARTEHEWFTFSTRSLIPGFEHVRSIYLHLNAQQSGYFAPLLHTEDASVSYFDPAWSSDGKYLAYVQQNADGTGHGLYVQEFGVADDIEPFLSPGADTKIGSPILVATAGGPRHPNWKPGAHTLVFDASTDGTRDLWTIDVDVVGGTTSNLAKRTFDGAKGESDPSWSPNGHDILYTTNKNGPNVLEIVDTALSSGDPGYIRLAETNFTFVSHNNGDWTPNGDEIFYDAPTNEDPAGVSAVWRLNLVTQGKCMIQFDERADGDPDVSQFNQTTQAPDNLPFNYFVMTSQGGNFGLATWRANAVNSCFVPLAMGVEVSPQNINLNGGGGGGQGITSVIRFPAETKAQGYVCRSGNVGGEGVRLRSSIFNSPTMAGIPCPTNASVRLAGFTPVPNTECYDTVDTTSVTPLVIDRTITCRWSRRDVADRLVALGLTDRNVPLEMTAYSNRTGRKFQGFAYIKVSGGGGGASSSVALLSNSPNPFNPVTRIKFAVSKAGHYDLRIYNIHGALVRTIASGRYDVGTHEATWDGRTTVGGKAASGVYYAKISGKSGDGSSDAIRLVLAK